LNASPEFDLVLTDFKMPDGDGVHLVEELRKKSGVPVLFVTSFTQEPAILRLLEKNIVQGCVRKPLEDNEFKLMMEETLGPKLPEAFGPRSSVRSG
jgi:CheY-like chemotaxis protein